jgi:hypothetical protein
MELNKTPLTYQQASELLGVSLETIKKAVLRGVLTRLPREGLYQHLMVGQVQLFMGKTLSLSVLDSNDRKLWQAYADSVYQPSVLDRSHLQATTHVDTSPAGRSFAETSLATSDRSDLSRYSDVALASALAAGIAALAVSGNSPKTSEGLAVLALALLVAGGLLWLLDEQDKQKREQAIEQAVQPIVNPGDRFTVKKLLEDETLIERLRTIHATAAIAS